MDHAHLPPLSAEDIAVVGLGKMGQPMARNLLTKLGPVTVWNRTAAAAAQLGDLGARVAPTLTQAARPVVLTVLPDLPDVVTVVEQDGGLAAGWRAGGTEHPVLVVHGTVSPPAVREFANVAWRRYGARVVDAPVSGGPQGAREATLSIMVGGDAATVTRLRPVLEHLGSVVRHLGDVGAGQVAKACNQVVVAGTMSAVSEAVLLARRSGVDVTALLAVLAGGLAGSEVLRQKGAHWVEQSYEAGGSVRNQLKDLRIVSELARSAGSPTPVTDVVRQLFEELAEAGDGELDHSAVYRAIERRTQPG